MKRNLQIQIEDDEEEKKFTSQQTPSRTTPSPMKTNRRPTFGGTHIEMLQ